ncbi:DUF2325 domain-containing protein [Bacillaceae bacterium Marseille-Q3522]|nr:DUF2325 domain-containing protein [Bacillaceae bacterium Marseille-Q3522]
MHFNRATNFLGYDTEEIQWDNETQSFKECIQEIVSLPLQIENIQKLIKELTEEEKLLLSNHLNFSFAKREKKHFPDLLFKKEISQFMQEIKKDHINSMVKLYQAFLLVLIPILENEDENTFAYFLSQHKILMKKFGPWHYYWAFMFHPGKSSNPVLWEQFNQGFPERLKKWKIEELMYTSDLLNENKENDENSIITKNSRKIKIKKLEMKLNNEMNLRISLEEELTKEKNEKIKAEDKLNQAMQTIDMLEKELKNEKARAEEIMKQSKTQKEKWEESKNHWYKERKALHGQIKSAGDKLVVAHAVVLEKTKEIHSLENKQKKLETALHDKHDKNTLGKELIKFLYDDLDTITAQLKNSVFKKASAGKKIRERAKDILTLVDQLEEYISPLTTKKEENQEIEENTNKFTEKTDFIKTADSQSPYESSAGREDEEWYTGTFQRLDHGGIITLDNGRDSFRIPESIVNKHELQHDAEVRCKPMHTDNGAVRYEIELLFQGDDQSSNINQYDGYIKMGEHNIFYCVELNDPEKKYMVHGRDVMVQELADGCPCTFNVAEGSHIARISRLYKMYEYEKREATFSNREASSINNNNKKKLRPKQTEYLNGVRIAVVGGQKKWFESVVTETGAEFIHNDGYTPERIHADIKRSNAIFLFLKSNSHRATQGCMEVAKEYNVPHFIIEGSKSNLRQLLWDNREVILGK